MNPTSNAANTPFIILISLIATIGGFLFGFDSGVINGTYEGLKAAFNLTTTEAASSVASMLIGCAVGAFFAGWMADHFGRRAVLIIAALLFVVSAWGSGAATGNLEFVVYRVLGGLAVGAASVICPAYISEVALAKYRGKLTSVQQIAIIVGLTASFVSNYCLAKWSGSSVTELWWGYETWRWMFWMELIPAIIFFFALLFIPESPRFLMASNQKSKASVVLVKLYGEKDGNTKALDIENSLAADHHKPRFADLYDKVAKRIRPIVWVGIGLAVLQQFVGINVIFYYGAVLWQAAGFTESHALLINVVSGAVSIAACLVTFFIVDKIGRKPILWIGSIGMAVTLALVAFAFAGAPIDENGKLVLSDNMGILALVAANLYVVFFNFSWGPVMWIMLGEMFPNQIRGTGLAIAGLAQWTANWLVTVSFPKMLEGLGLTVTYSVYTVFAIISVFFVLRFVHETKGKELEQMEG